MKKSIIDKFIYCVSIIIYLILKLDKKLTPYADTVNTKINNISDRIMYKHKPVKIKSLFTIPKWLLIVAILYGVGLATAIYYINYE